MTDHSEKSQGLSSGQSDWSLCVMLIVFTNQNLKIYLKIKTQVNKKKTKHGHSFSFAYILYPILVDFCFIVKWLLNLLFVVFRHCYKQNYLPKSAENSMVFFFF